MLPGRCISDVELLDIRSVSGEVLDAPLVAVALWKYAQIQSEPKGLWRDANLVIF